jgi:hypothetical protein
MFFQIGSSADIVAYTGTVTLGTVTLTPITEVTLPSSSSITISYKSNVIEWLPTLLGVSASKVAGVIAGMPFLAGSPPPYLTIIPAPPNSLILNFAAATTFGPSDMLCIGGIQVNLPGFSGSHETGFKAVCSASSPAPFSNPITFAPGFVPVARFN